MVFWLTAAVGIVLIPIVAVFAISWRSFKPPRILTPIPDLPDGIKKKPVSFPSSGRTLNGWVVSPSSSPRGAILLVHGWGSDSGEMMGWSLFLAEAGWLSLAFDMRGHGRSEETDPVSLPDLTADVEAAQAFLTRHPDSASLPRAILGHSMGGAAVLLGLSRGITVEAAIISSAFARMETLTEYVLKKRFLPPILFRGLVMWVWRLRMGKSIREVEPEATIRGLTLPLHLAHGTRDKVIPDREIDRLATVAPPETVIHSIAGAGHEDLVDFPEYRRGVLEFLDRHLAQGGQLNAPAQDTPRP